FRMNNNNGNGDFSHDDGGGDGPVVFPVGVTNPRPHHSGAPLVSKELISFKALVTDNMLAVRGYLRLDYREAPAAGDSQIAYPFGEFRFFGCRKIVTTAHNSQIARRNFALAPKGSKFDRMWFTGIEPGLILFDGQFPALPALILPTVSTE